MILHTPADPAVLSELSVALKRSAVPSGLTTIRREASGDAYADHGRTTLRLASAKAAANRANRRAARQALSRALDGDDLNDVIRRSGKVHFRAKASRNSCERAAYELVGEINRQRSIAIAAWRQECDAWEAECRKVQQSHGYTAMSYWMMYNPRPKLPA